MKKQYLISLLGLAAVSVPMGNSLLNVNPKLLESGSNTGLTLSEKANNEVVFVDTAADDRETNQILDENDLVESIFFKIEYDSENRTDLKDFKDTDGGLTFEISSSGKSFTFSYNKIEEYITNYDNVFLTDYIEATDTNKAEASALTVGIDNTMSGGKLTGNLSANWDKIWNYKYVDTNETLNVYADYSLEGEDKEVKQEKIGKISSKFNPNLKTGYTLDDSSELVFADMNSNDILDTGDLLTSYSINATYVSADDTAKMTGDTSVNLYSSKTHTSEEIKNNQNAKEDITIKSTDKLKENHHTYTTGETISASVNYSIGDDTYEDNLGAINSIKTIDSSIEASVAATKPIVNFSGETNTTASVDYLVSPGHDGAGIENTCLKIKWVTSEWSEDKISEQEENVLAKSNKITGTLTTDPLEKNKDYGNTKIIVQDSNDKIIANTTIDPFTTIQLTDNKINNINIDPNKDILEFNGQIQGAGASAEDDTRGSVIEDINLWKTTPNSGSYEVQANIISLKYDKDTELYTYDVWTPNFKAIYDEEGNIENLDLYHLQFKYSTSAVENASLTYNDQKSLYDHAYIEGEEDIVTEADLSILVDGMEAWKVILIIISIFVIIGIFIWLGNLLYKKYKPTEVDNDKKDDKKLEESKA